MDFSGKAVSPVTHPLPRRVADARRNLQRAGPREPRPPSLLLFLPKTANYSLEWWVASPPNAKSPTGNGQTGKVHPEGSVVDEAAWGIMNLHFSRVQGQKPKEESLKVGFQVSPSQPIGLGPCRALADLTIV